MSEIIGSGTAVNYCKRCGIVLPTLSMYKFDGYCPNCRIALYDRDFTR